MTAITILGWVLIHFLWQGAAIACLLALVLGLAGRRSPSVRYLLAVTALLMMAAMPVATAVRLAARDVGAVTGAAGADPAVSGPNGRETTAAAVPSAGTAESRSARSTTPSLLPAAAQAQALRAIDRLMPWLVVAWFACVMALSLRLVSGWLWTRHLRMTGVKPISPQFLEMVDRMARRLRVSRPVRVLESTLVQVPAVIGSLRPIILMPVSLPAGLTPLQLEALLLHELAHVRRHDYTVNFLQSVLETLLFYHPAVWWVSGRIREEREQCCDDLAVAECGDARLYAGALFELERARAQAPALAAAATGDGSLTRRIQRLLSPLPSHAETGHRWVAGALVAIALLVGLGGNVPFSRSSPVEAAGKNEVEKKIRSRSGGPARASAPARVILHPGPGSASLEERWGWAAQVARRERLSSYWIGYAVKGRPDEYGWIYLDRHVPVSANEGLVFSGRMRTTGTLDEFHFTGVPLDGLVGSRPPRDIAILYGFRAGELERVHAGSFAIPVHFDDRALIWLGEGDDAGSVGLARSLFDRARDTELKKDLVAVVGTHAEGTVTTPVLAGWLRGEEAEEIRAEAAELLGEQDDPAALPALVSAANDDLSSDVRREAAEAVGELRVPGALDAHIKMARTLPDPEARREAVESLSQRGEKEALDEAARIAREDEDSEIQREAVETLGEFEGRRGLPHLMEIARSHPESDVRREAAETLAEAASSEEALALLQRIAQEDPDSDVRCEAVESIGEIRGSSEKVLNALEEVAHQNSDVEAQREAAETLGEIQDERAVKILVELAERHPRLAVQKKAIESLGEVAPTAAKEALIRLAREHPTEEVQREAIETLGEAQHHDPETLERLADTVRSHPRLQVRKEAMESYAQWAPPAAAAALLTDLARDDASYEIRETAVEALADLPDSAGIEPLLAIARAHPEREIRRKAIEALAESDDPRAIDLIEEILMKP